MAFKCDSVTGPILGHVLGMVWEQRERGQLPVWSAGQRCLHEKVTPELSLKHDLRRISKSRNGAGGSANA